MLFTYYDTETSGIEKDCDVLSFSYMLADENLRVERAETLYFWKEGRTKWTQDAYKVHGLSKEFCVSSRLIMKQTLERCILS